MTKAWHLRNDGESFPITVHVYPMQDENLASEAEVASFIIATNSKDQEYAKYVLDAFMALQIENIASYDANEDNIDSSIVTALSNLPFKFAYPLEIKDMLDIHKSQRNFYDIDTLYDFIDEIRGDIEHIWSTISESFNQQFCRVRYGGEYNSTSGEKGIWFRIASVGYNWDNVIYQFASDMRRKLGIRYITICRDAESDGLESEYFYKAKDGSAYYYMPIDEFLSEEHESNPVFAKSDIGSGVIHTIRNELKRGNTLIGAYDILASSGLNNVRNYRQNLFASELRNQYIEASKWFDELNTRTKQKINKVKNTILQKYDEILDMDVDFDTWENRNGNPVGFRLDFTLTSDEPKIDNQIISVVNTKSLGSTTAEYIINQFRREYVDFVNFRKIYPV